MFAKFRVWSLWRQGYTRVLYLDTDVLVARSLDAHLWSTTFEWHEAIAATPTLTDMRSLGDEPTCTEFMDSRKNRRRVQFNAGMYLLRPSEALERAMVNALYKPPAVIGGGYPCGDGDQSAFNLLLARHARCLSHAFNCYDPYYLVGDGPRHTCI